MHSRKSDGHTPDHNGRANHEVGPARQRRVPEPRVVGTGYGAIGIAAVAAAVRYQGSSNTASQRAGVPGRRT
jgi:hypothetical protein